jgi:hypothetical protein
MGRDSGTTRRSFLKLAVIGTAAIGSGSCMASRQIRTRDEKRDRKLQRFKPTTDLHYHMDAMSPRAIYAVGKKFDLPWSGRTLDEITALASVAPGVSWKEWYKAHSNARAAVFVRPEVFADVAREAVIDAELEGLQTRVMRFSLTMPEYCFKEKHRRKPDLSETSERSEFLSYLDAIIGNISTGLSGSRVNVPLVFSVSCQDTFLPILDDVAAVIMNHPKIAGIDLTNEQTHRLATEYQRFVRQIMQKRYFALTIHTGEQEAKAGVPFSARLRTLSALSMKPNTLGHAIYAANDPELIRSIAESRVVVELCPSSNLYLNQEFVDNVLNGDFTRYPLLTFRDAGVPVTINSDVPGSIGSSLANEFEIMRRIFGLNESELRMLDDTARETAKRVYGI